MDSQLRGIDVPLRHHREAQVPVTLQFGQDRPAGLDVERRAGMLQHRLMAHVEDVVEVVDVLPRLGVRSVEAEVAVPASELREFVCRRDGFVITDVVGACPARVFEDRGCDQLDFHTLRSEL
ncbi:hypothetical protein Chy1_0045 [Mycobacterium phage Chy1]|uniref:Uncharacterized protein n=1 Tax=Mycobacterium phage Chy1 TaxID=1219531 RepID=R4JKL6_BPMD2|nr:hypothetical protein Chy1_0045 [Mycobacterium phage Chy1]